MRVTLLGRVACCAASSKGPHSSVFIDKMRLFSAFDNGTNRELVPRRDRGADARRERDDRSVLVGDESELGDVDRVVTECFVEPANTRDSRGNENIREIRERRRVSLLGEALGKLRARLVVPRCGQRPAGPRRREVFRAPSARAQSSRFNTAFKHPDDKLALVVVVLVLVELDRDRRHLSVRCER